MPIVDNLLQREEPELGVHRPATMAQEQEQISKGEADAASVQPSVKRNLFATTLAEVDRANVSWMSLSVSVRVRPVNTSFFTTVLSMLSLL